MVLTNYGGSPPCGWCGLKSQPAGLVKQEDTVTTLRVVWIEINNVVPDYVETLVTTLRVVWIEIQGYLFYPG